MDSTRRVEARRRRKRLSSMLAAVFLGAVGTMAVIAFVRGGARAPALTEERFESAQQQWRERGPRNYSIEIRVEGRQPATYFVEVADGIAVRALRNNQPLRQERTFATWSVPGMFGTMKSDVDHVAQQQSGEAVMGPQLRLRAQFHQELGYPIRYERTEMVKFGNNRSVTWEVTSFSAPDA